MNPRLEKLRQEREKLAEKLTSLTARLKALDEQILKLENTDIVGIVRENGLTIEQLAALFLMIRRPPRSTLFPTRRSSDLDVMRKLLFCGNACDEFSHVSANHIQIDVQHDFMQFGFMIADVCF